MERMNVSPIERELLFENWCKKGNVEISLIDLDDTLCATRELFIENYSKTYDYLASVNSIYPRSVYKTTMEAINNRLFESHGVNPNRLFYLMQEASEVFELSSDLVINSLGVLGKIYQIPPAYYEESEEVLSFLKKLPIPFGIVTHANKEWTWRKYQWLKLDRFLDWDDIYIVHEDGHKGPEEWLAALNYFKVKPKNCAVFGDSPRSDIIPAQTIGVEKLFLIDRGALWSVHDRPVGENVVTMKNLRELMDLGLPILQRY